MSNKAKDTPKQSAASGESKAEKDSPVDDNLGLVVLKEIEEEAPDLLEPLPPKDKERLGLLLAARIVSKIHRGPLPPPEDIAAYNNYIPDGANRIMCMAEEALRGQIKIGELSLEAQIKQKADADRSSVSPSGFLASCRRYCSLAGKRSCWRANSRVHGGQHCHGLHNRTEATTRQ